MNIEWHPERDMHALYRQGIPFEAFYFVMASDEREMETNEARVPAAPPKHFAPNPSSAPPPQNRQRHHPGGATPTPGW